MPTGQRRLHIDTKAMVALLLTFSAGCVDVIGYLALYHAFTAHMTGETVHLAHNIFQERWFQVIKAGGVIAAFLAGSIAGRVVIEFGARRRIRSIASATLLAEAALIAGVIPLAARPHISHSLGLGLLAMLAFAMGLQTATLTRIGSLTVHTTFVTGMLNKLAQLLSQAVFLTYDNSRGKNETDHRRRVLREARFITSIWLLYWMGAVTGVWLDTSWGLRSLVVPAVVVASGILMDQASPLSLEEEREEP